MGSGRWPEAEKKADPDAPARPLVVDQDRGVPASNRAVAGGLAGDGASLAVATTLGHDAGNQAVARIAAGGNATRVLPAWYVSADPLAPYTAFKAANPAAYAALASTAEQYTLRTSDQVTEPAPGTAWRTRTEVPLAAL